MAAQSATTSDPISGTTIKIDLVPIPAGTITTTDPSDPSKKTETKVGPFYMSTTEVTWDQYDIFVNRLDEPDPGAAAVDADATTHPSKPYISYDRNFGHTGYAVIGISFHGATHFCNWLSKKTGHKYRLATEAEWEYAAHAGTTGDYSGGVDPSQLADIAWYKDNAEEKTHPIASKKPNAWGLFDMTGNVAEWTVGPDSKPIVKGGSFKESPDGLKISSRVKPTPAWNASDPQIPKSKWWLADCTFVGFRIIREPDTATPAVKPEEPKTAPPPPPKKERTDDHPVPK